MKALRYAVLVVLTALFISPLLFVVLTSFKTARQAVQTPPTWIPDPFTTQAYERILTATDTPVFRWFLNSMFAATLNADPRGRDLGARGVRPGSPGVPRQEVRVRADRVDAVRAAGDPGDPQLRDRRAALLAGHADRDHRAHRRRAFGVFFLRQFFMGLPWSWRSRRSWTAPTGGRSSPGSCCRCRSRPSRRWRCCRS